MKILYFLVLTIATSVLASPLAYSAPSHGTQITYFYNTFSEGASGCNSDYYFYSCFYANTHDDFFSGQPLGMVEAVVYDYDYNLISYIECSGPAYANVVSVNKNNGDSSINATLDPSSGDCSSNNVSAPVTFYITGKYNGNFRSSNNGTSEEMVGRFSYKSNFQSDAFYETFTGTNGFYSGAFDGYVNTEHRTNRQKVK